MKRSFGLSLSRHDDGTTVRPFVDLMKLARPWGNLADPWNSGYPKEKLTKEGLPTSDAAAFVLLTNYPASPENVVYHFRYSGSGVLKFMSGAANQLTNNSGNVTYGTVAIDGNSRNLSFQLTNIDPANPPSGLSIVYEPYVNSVNCFTKAFSALVQPFDYLRFMDWFRSNDVQWVNWSDRVLPTESQSSERGVAYEYAIALSNETKKDIWINVPDTATDDYARQMARLFRDGLTYNQNIYFEVANECWNSSFQVRDRLIALSSTFSDLTATDDSGKSYQVLAAILKRWIDIWKYEFKDSGPSRVRPILAGQAVNTWTMQKSLEYYEMKNGSGSVKNDIYAFAYADYFVSSHRDSNWDVIKWDQPGDSATAAQIFSYAIPRMDKEDALWIKTWKALADQYGVKLVTYEGGQNLKDKLSGPSQNHTAKLAAQTNPLMAVAYNKAFDLFFDGGGASYTLYASPGLWGPGDYGYWGLKQGWNDTKSGLKWDTAIKAIKYLLDVTVMTKDSKITISSEGGATVLARYSDGSSKEVDL